MSVDIVKTRMLCLNGLMLARLFVVIKIDMLSLL